jgi:hypothetical protein
VAWPVIRYLLWTTTLFIASSIVSFAQDAGMPASDAGRTVPRTIFSAETSQWKEVQQNAPGKNIAEILAEAGWPSIQVDTALNPSGQYNLYKKVVSPGVDSYLVAPVDGSAAPVQFGSGVTSNGDKVTLAGWSMSGYSSDEIRKQILDGIQAAIDALCSMKVKPSQIRAQASAFGVVEVEATWQSTEVCQP